jgi:hypothetical protein
MAVMVWCNNCQTVVWAYDEQKNYDIRGLVNEFGLSCPNCNRQHCFDGWGSDKPTEQLHRYSKEIVDGWSAMRYVAKSHNLNWNPSTDNHWNIGAYQGLRNSIARWKIEKSETQDELKLAKLDGKIEALNWLLGENKYDNKD